MQLLDNDNGRGLVFSFDEIAMTSVADAEYATIEATCGAQGTSIETGTGTSLIACNRRVLEVDEASGDELWRAETACEEVEFGMILARWYPLLGW